MQRGLLPTVGVAMPPKRPEPKLVNGGQPGRRKRPERPEAAVGRDLGEGGGYGREQPLASSGLESVRHGLRPEELTDDEEVPPRLEPQLALPEIVHDVERCDHGSVGRAGQPTLASEELILVRSIEDGRRAEPRPKIHGAMWWWRSRLPK